MSIGIVNTVGELRKMLEGLEDDLEVVVVARQRVSLEDALHNGHAVPYNFTDVEMTLENIDKEEGFIHFECEIPSSHFYKDN